MTLEIWKLTYKVLKVNGQAYDKRPEMIREHRENMPGLLKRAAEDLAEKYSFGLVEIVSKSTESGEEFKGMYEMDEGFRDEWVTGRQ